MNKTSFLLVGFLSCLTAASASAQKVEPKVKIGRDTTYIDGPVTKDGYIDYVSHLNSVLSKGVTSENNAAVLLLKAYPGEINDDKFMKRYCKALGIAPIPVKGDYYQGYFRYGIALEEKRKNRKLTNEEMKKANDAFMEEYNKAIDGPWTRKDFPKIAKWLDENEKYLKMVRKATLRSHYYHPMLNGEGDDSAGVIAILLPQAQSTREFARALMIRAMMYLGEGEIEKCCEDILTMRRLGNHIASGATIVEQLVGIAIVGIAQSAERRLAFSGKLSADQLLDYRAKMKKHAMKSNMVRSFGECERFMYLDAVQQVMKGGITAMNQLMGLTNSGPSGGTSPQTQMRKLLDTVIANSTDWSLTMKEGNRIYDKYGKVLKSKDWQAQDDGIAEMEKEIKEMAQSVNGTSAMVKVMLGGPEYRGKMMGKIFVGLLLPALNAATNAEKRIQITDDISYIVLSAAAHKAEQGSYPDSIKSFRGEAGKGLPIDRYSNEDFRYKRQGDGFIVYSIGANRKDDGGNGVYNEKMDRGDDYGAGYETLTANAKAQKDLN